MRRANALALFVCFAGMGACAWAQASCSSDGQPPPTALYERFTSADCEDCWAHPAATTAPGGTTLLIDWITPGTLGDDAPLSAAATRDALERLQAIARPTPSHTDTHVDAVPPLPATALLRVAQGPVVANYVGASIRFIPPALAADTHYRVTLLLVEAVEAGTEGTPVARNIARNALQLSWDKRHQLPKKEHGGWFEIRPMHVPEGARPERLRLVAWVGDAQGQPIAAAQTHCAAGR